MKNDLFYIEKNTNPIKETTLYTTVDSKQNIDQLGFYTTTDEDNACAKKITNNDTNKHRFFIKIDTYGKAYNPIGLYSENQINKFSSKAGKNIYTFKETNEKAFTHYLNFLKTKNLAWLRNTEREME